MLTITKVPRIIYYYELNFKYWEDFEPKDGDQFRELFMIIVRLVNSRHRDRYKVTGFDKTVIIQDIKFDNINKYVEGRLRSVRTDLFPEFMNTLTDTTKDIEVEDQEGIVETTHFVISYSKRKKKIAIEYNQYGPKINDLIKYIEAIGNQYRSVKMLVATPVVQDVLSTMKDRMGALSEFKVKIHKDKIAAVKAMDESTYEVLKNVEAAYQSEYLTLDLKYDYKKVKENGGIKKSIQNLIRNIGGNLDVFNTLKIKAEDKHKDYKLEVFDLLVDKVKSVVRVERKPKYRTLVTLDMFDKLKSEMIRKGI